MCDEIKVKFAGGVINFNFIYRYHEKIFFLLIGGARNGENVLQEIQKVAPSIGQKSIITKEIITEERP